MPFPRFPQLRTIRAGAFSTSARSNALSPAALPRAQKLSADWKGTSATGANTKNFIAGEFVESKSSEWIDVHDPVRILPALSQTIRSLTPSVLYSQRKLS